MYIIRTLLETYMREIFIKYLLQNYIK